MVILKSQQRAADSRRRIAGMAFLVANDPFAGAVGPELNQENGVVVNHVQPMPIVPQPVPVAVPLIPVRLDEIKSMIQMFSGNRREYPVREWILDFENVMNAINGTLADKLRLARQLFSGDAATWIKRHVDGSLDEMKEVMIVEFHEPMPKYDVYEEIEEATYLDRPNST